MASTVNPGIDMPYLSLLSISMDWDPFHPLQILHLWSIPHLYNLE